MALEIRNKCERCEKSLAPADFVWNALRQWPVPAQIAEVNYCGGRVRLRQLIFKPVFGKTLLANYPHLD